ncbi:MAG: hypothetical protein HY515_02385 [Candidatus Aenigmarchaeota archaeon]|nr:hypothetical protein [Candidatus Aenigmarchaeota archaeon]
MELWTKQNQIFAYFLTLSLILLPLMAVAQPTSGDLSKSFAKLLNVPESTMTGANLVWFVLIPWALMLIIVYGILDEIKLFRKGGINFAIAFLATIMMIPTNVLGQIIIGIYGGGLTTLVVIVGISILPRFLDVFGPRTGLPTAVLEILSAATYGLMMYFVFGFLTAQGAVLAGYSWLKWVMTVGVPLLVLFRGYLGRHAPLSRQLGAENRVVDQEIRAAREEVEPLRRALENLARIKEPATANLLAGYTPALQNTAVQDIIDAGGADRGWTPAWLRARTGNEIRELARRLRV